MNRVGHSYCEVLNSTMNKNWFHFQAIYLVRLKIQTHLILPKTRHVFYKRGEDPFSDARAVSALLGGQLHPRSNILTSYNTQLPSVIANPVFHCPVPVVQTYTSLLPVDTQLKLFSLSVFFIDF